MKTKPGIESLMKIGGELAVERAIGLVVDRHSNRRFAWYAPLANTGLGQGHPEERLIRAHLQHQHAAEQIQIVDDMIEDQEMRRAHEEAMRRRMMTPSGLVNLFKLRIR